MLRGAISCDTPYQPYIYIYSIYPLSSLRANSRVHARASFFVPRWPISPGDKPIDKTQGREKIGKGEREREREERENGSEDRSH